MGEQEGAVSNSNIFDIKSHKREKRMRVGHREHTAWIIAVEEANLVTNQ